MNENIGVISMGIKTPIIKEGDDIVDIVVNSVLEATKIGQKFVQPNSNVKGLVEVPGQYNYDINHHDVIGITESVVARAHGNYVTIDEIALDIQMNFGGMREYIVVANPIYSRNRFSMILKAITRATSKGVIIYMPDADEVGNPSGINQFTGVNIKDYYTELVNKEGRECIIHDCAWTDEDKITNKDGIIYCGLHDYEQWKADYGNNYRITLVDICSNKCEYGLLGSNKATEEKLKLFPNKVKAQKVVEEIQEKIADKTGKLVYVCIYGDGCFKDAVGGIWEFADPVTMPAYTNSEIFESTPNEIKIKYLADNKYENLNGKELEEAISKEIEEYKGKDLKGSMTSEGTTPRLYRDLLASLMDLTSGSGMRGTPVVLVKNYFNNFAS